MKFDKTHQIHKAAAKEKSRFAFNLVRFNRDESRLEATDGKILAVVPVDDVQPEVISHTRTITGAAIPAKTSARRLGDPARLVCDSSKARTALGWRPVHDLDSMIQDAWVWHQHDGYAL